MGGCLSHPNEDNLSDHQEFLQEIIPWLLLSLEPDNVKTFTGKVSQNLAKVLNVDLKLYCVYRPQS